ncbi:MAG: hypothetical protein WBK91_02335 [Alphaproteobacteria bacterium]
MQELPFLLKDALQGIGNTHPMGTTAIFENFLYRATAKEKQEMTPLILSAITRQMQTAHDIIDGAPQREAALRKKIAAEGFGDKVRGQVATEPNDTATASRKLELALNVLRPVVCHASGFINSTNAGSLQQLLVDTFVKESVNFTVRYNTGLFLAGILNRNPSAFAAPKRAQPLKRTTHQKVPKSPK